MEGVYHMEFKQGVPIYAKLKYYRELQNLTQEEVAAEAGIPVYFYSRYESGQADLRKTSCDIAERITKSLGINTRNLF